jgi:hypothetical protein
VKKLIPIGIDDFRHLREQNLTYVDKTQLVRGVLDHGAQVILLPRPRRFGKSLNLSMLRCFFEKRDEDFSSLFEGLSITQAGEPYRAHFQRHPVIYLTLKGIKAATWENAWASLRRKIEGLFQTHSYLLAGTTMDEWEVRGYRAMLDGTADRALYETALVDLSRYLHLYHGEKVVLLVDEYDEPIHAGYAGGYTAEILEFFRAFLTEGLKGNPHLFKAVLTGILRVAKESIFSGLNNLAVFSLLRSDFNDCFGFTEPEVAALLAEAGRSEMLGLLRTWYNGYIFGGKVVYNPWSILNYVASEDVRPRSYWVSTSSNDLIRDLLQRYALEIQPEVEALLEGGSVERRLDENVVLADLTTREDALWSLLVFSGYLKAEELEGPLDEAIVYRLSIPNLEVRDVYTSTFRGWMADRLGGRGGDLARLTRALLSGDAERLEDQLQAFTTNVLSYHDTGAVDPEQVYHAFVIGLLASLEPEYLVRSNRESGRGRPDVTIRPKQAGKPGVVLELKVARPGRKTPEQALEEALSQIRENDYGAELRAAGATPIHALAVVFDGKRAWVRAAEE